MSIKATSWAARTATGSAPLKLMLFAFANYADDEGVCWPSQETLANDTEQSVDTVQRRSKKLEAMGLIRIERREGNRGQWAGKIYYLNMSVAEMSKPQPERKSPTTDVQAAPDHAATRTVTMPQPGRPPCRKALRHKLPIEPLLEPPAPTARSSHAERLQAFQSKEEGSEVVQNRIAQRLGPDGWLILGELTDEHRAMLTTLERRGKLDDRALNAAVLDARARALHPALREAQT
ncbi:MAG TPA: helix-turn-helix domain-containing protein [Tardiphaga sp.]